MLLSYSSVLLVDTGKILLSVRIHDLNEPHIHPSTCSSTLRTSFKSGRFLTIFFLLSDVSKKLCNSWHIVYISIQNPISFFRSILTRCYFSQFSFFEYEILHIQKRKIRLWNRLTQNHSDHSFISFSFLDFATRSIIP